MATLPLYKNYGLGLIFANGSFAVDVFIILSGFVIAHLINTNKETYKLFILRRALRLFPVYLFALLISACMVDLSIAFLENLQWEHPKTINRLAIFEQTKVYFYFHLFTHSLLLHGLFPQSMFPLGVYTFLGQAWSLTLEWQFYICAPFILYFFKRGAIYQMITLSILLIIEYFTHQYFGYQSFLFSNISLFILGIICNVIFTQYRNKRLNEASYFKYISFTCMIFMTYKTLNNGPLYMIPVIVWYITIISESTNASYWLFKLASYIVNLPAILYIGKISYSAYCLHMIFLYSFGYLFNNILQIQYQIFYALLMLIVPIIFTLFFSGVTYKYIEKPFIKIGKKM